MSGQKLKDVLAHILKEYPHPSEMSNARVNKLVYLSDWKHCIDNSVQITDINWYFDNFGPFVHDIKVEAQKSPELFILAQDKNYWGEPKTLFRLADESYRPQLTVTERKAIDHAIKVTSPLNFSDFIRLVYSTYPIINSSRYTHLDLVQMAAEYRERKAARKITGSVTA